MPGPFFLEQSPVSSRQPIADSQWSLADSNKFLLEGEDSSRSNNLRSKCVRISLIALGRTKAKSKATTKDTKGSRRMLQQKSFVYLRALCGSSFCCSVCIGVSVSLR